MNRISLVTLYDEERQNLFITWRDDRKQCAVRDVLSIHWGGRYQIFLTVVVKIFVNPASVDDCVQIFCFRIRTRLRSISHSVSGILIGKVPVKVNKTLLFFNDGGKNQNYEAVGDDRISYIKFRYCPLVFIYSSD